MAIYKVTYWNDQEEVGSRPWELITADMYDVVRSPTTMAMDSIAFKRNDNTVVKEIFCRPRSVELIEEPNGSEDANIQI